MILNYKNNDTDAYFSNDIDIDEYIDIQDNDEYIDRIFLNYSVFHNITNENVFNNDQNNIDVYILNKFLNIIYNHFYNQTFYELFLLYNTDNNKIINNIIRYMNLVFNNIFVYCLQKEWKNWNKVFNRFFNDSLFYDTIKESAFNNGKNVTDVYFLDKISNVPIPCLKKITDEIKFLLLRYSTISNNYLTLINIYKYYLPIFILGLVGNCLTAFVLFQKKMRFFSSSIYLSALAISDIGSLMLLCIGWLYVMDIFKIVFVSYVKIILQQYFFCLSQWLIAIFTVERYIVIKYPFLCRSWCTVYRAKIAVITLMGLAILYNIPYAFCIYTINISTNELLHLVTSDNFTNIKNINKIKISFTKINVYYIFENILNISLFTIEIILNLCMAYHIWKKYRARIRLIPELSISNKRISNNKMSEMIGMTLILFSNTFVNLCLLIFWLTKITDMYASIETWYIQLLIHNLLGTLTCGLNFVFYGITGQRVRKELISMFRCLNKRSDTKQDRNVMEMKN